MKAQVLAQFRSVFARNAEVVTRAPGRIEFIGNHTDYNGGTVLGAAIDRGVWVAVAPRADGRRRFYSAFAEGIVELTAGAPEKQKGDASWTNYPLGVLAAMPHFGLRVPDGFDLLAASDLPPGAGLSSSAAIELASVLAFTALTGEQPAREVAVKVAKHAENHFVGVPCGILDQGVSGFGQANHLVHIDCRGPVFSVTPLPAHVHFWIFNTHSKHALVDGLYADRHRECMEAARLLGVALLADVPPNGLDARLTPLPAVLAKRAKHVIEEIDRVRATVAALKSQNLAEVGRLLTASHRSSQHLFENSTPELDRLVDLATANPQVLGARLTGGGFGGAIMALTTDAFTQADADAIADAYAKSFGARPDTLHCQTAPGAERLN